MGSSSSKVEYIGSYIGHLEGTSYHQPGTCTSWKKYYESHINIKNDDDTYENVLCPCKKNDQNHSLVDSSPYPIGAHVYHIDNDGYITFGIILTCNTCNTGSKEFVSTWEMFTMINCTEVICLPFKTTLKNLQEYTFKNNNKLTFKSQFKQNNPKFARIDKRVSGNYINFIVNLDILSKKFEKKFKDNKMTVYTLKKEENARSSPSKNIKVDIPNVIEHENVFEVKGNDGKWKTCTLEWDTNSSYLSEYKLQCVLEEVENKVATTEYYPTLTLVEQKTINENKEENLTLNIETYKGYKKIDEESSFEIYKFIYLKDKVWRNLSNKLYKYWCRNIVNDGTDTDTYYIKKCDNCSTYIMNGTNYYNCKNCFYRLCGSCSQEHYNEKHQDYKGAQNQRFNYYGESYLSCVYCNYPINDKRYKCKKCDNIDCCSDCYDKLIENKNAFSESEHSHGRDALLPITRYCYSCKKNVLTIKTVTMAIIIAKEDEEYIIGITPVCKECMDNKDKKSPFKNHRYAKAVTIVDFYSLTSALEFPKIEEINYEKEKTKIIFKRLFKKNVEFENNEMTTLIRFIHSMHKIRKELYQDCGAKDKKFLPQVVNISL